MLKPSLLILVSFLFFRNAWGADEQCYPITMSPDNSAAQVCYDRQTQTYRIKVARHWWARKLKIENPFLLQMLNPGDGELKTYVVPATEDPWHTQTAIFTNRIRAQLVGDEFHLYGSFQLEDLTRVTHTPTDPFEFVVNKSIRWIDVNLVKKDPGRHLFHTESKMIFPALANGFFITAAIDDHGYHYGIPESLMPMPGTTLPFAADFPIVRVHRDHLRATPTGTTYGDDISRNATSGTLGNWFTRRKLGSLIVKVIEGSAGDDRKVVFEKAKGQLRALSDGRRTAACDRLVAFFSLDYEL